MKEELKTGNINVLMDCERFYKAFFAILEPEVPLYEIDATSSKKSVLQEVLIILEELMKKHKCS